MIIDEKEFNRVCDTMLRTATEYHKLGDTKTCGIYFDKENSVIRIISLYFFIEIQNADIRIDVPKNAPFFNIINNEWTDVPFARPMEEYMERKARSYEFVGRTEYYAKNIMSIIQKEEEKTMKLKTRYVFVQGFLDEGTAILTFKSINDRLYSEIKGRKFVVDKNSFIPEQYVIPGLTYAVSVTGTSNGCITVDVIERFGRTRSGLYVTETVFNAEKCLPLLDKIRNVHEQLTECSDVLDTINNEVVMPPIHMNAMMLMDLLRIFTLNTSTKFSLHFQQNINSDIFMESIPEGDEDYKILIYASTLDYYRTIQRG